MFQKPERKNMAKTSAILDFTSGDIYADIIRVLFFNKLYILKILAMFFMQHWVPCSGFRVGGSGRGLGGFNVTAPFVLKPSDPPVPGTIPKRNGYGPHSRQ
jgi:hypothetical protein